MAQEVRTRGPDEMYCTSCGAVIKIGVQFCTHCGARISSAPQTASPSAARGVSQQAHAFSSSYVLARFVIGALLLVIIIGAVAVFSDIAELRLITRVINGEFVTVEEFEASDDRQAVIGALQIAALVVTAILFLVWIYRTHRNLPALRASGLKYSPNWAVGGWFIPIMNLWRPYQVIAEIWRASDPEISDPEGQAWLTAPVSPLIKIWWAFWIIGGVIGNFLLRSAFQEPEDIEAFRTQSITFIVSDGLDIVAAILAILVVLYIADRQEEKSRRLQGIS